MGKDKHIVNQHRGKRPDDLSQRYRRLRDEDDPGSSALYDEDDWYREFNNDLDDERGDLYWELYEPGFDPDLSYIAESIMECIRPSHFDVWNAAEEKLRPNITPSPEDENIPEAKADSSVFSISGLLEELRNLFGDSFESALALHVDKLVWDGRHRLKDDDFYLKFKMEIIEMVSKLDLCEKSAAYGIIAEDESMKHTVVMVLLFYPYWLRSLSSWVTPEGNLNARQHSLVEHLFAKHPVPSFLYDNWCRYPHWPRIKWICWFIIFGQGGSLRRAAKVFGWNVPKSIIRQFKDVPPGLNAVQGLIWAEVISLGGDTSLFERMCNNTAYIVDVTDRTRPDEFWRGTVCWLVKHRNHLSDNDIDMILIWAMHMWTELDRHRFNADILLVGDYQRKDKGENRFMWKNWGRRRALAAAEEYIRSLNKRSPVYNWNGHGWDWEDNSGQWAITELTSSEELISEGFAMKHCVGGYDAHCAQGYSAIFSLKQNRVRALTIEMNPHSKSIIQMRGEHNRDATVQERSIVMQWKAEILSKQAGAALH